MALGQHLQSALGNTGLPLKIVVAAFLLIGIEEVKEHHYKCPVSITLRKVYISLYFIIPGITLLVLGAYCQVYVLKLTVKTFGEKCHIVLWALSLASFWAVILLWDRRYIVCVCSPVEGNGTTHFAQDGPDVGTWSQIAAAILFLSILIANGFYIKHYYKKLKEFIPSEEVPKWEAKGKASYLPPPEDSHSGNRQDISFHCVITKPPPSQSTGGQDTEAEQLVPSAGVDSEMSPMQQSSPSTS